MGVLSEVISVGFVVLHLPDTAGLFYHSQTGTTAICWTVLQRARKI
jgi:hypothetical protein